MRGALIADRLGLSRMTVPTHIKNIYRKLEVNSRSEAVFEVLKEHPSELVVALGREGKKPGAIDPNVSWAKG